MHKEVVVKVAVINCFIVIMLHLYFFSLRIRPRFDHRTTWNDNFGVQRYPCALPPERTIPL
jgi:hypothetical protein